MDIDNGANSPSSVRVEKITTMEEINILVENSGRDESDAMDDNEEMEERDTTEDNDEDMGENDSAMDVQGPAGQSNAVHTLATTSTRRSTRDARPIFSSSSSSASPSIKKTKAKDAHMHTILREALPEGSVVSQETLERLAKAFTSIVKEASTAAAKAAVNKARTSTGVRAASGPRTIKHAVRKGRVTKPTTATTTPKKTGPGAKDKKKTKKKKTEEDDQEEKDELVDDEEETEEDEEEEVFEVESILEHKFVRGKILFKIKWSGYPVSQSTWETQASLDGCKDLLQAYAKKNKLTI
ncbi:hypothetical protein BGZ51_008035 [Haplosporangium sp. Z 767]|nr:hypothetical protein BGZ51_008035 [Haplosporangium sp. Z 767]KAF9178861.1 hypothetical protein BGZ50_007397 [Haplosporangium sp. Z 11]